MSIREQVTLDEVIAFLNDATESDRQAIGLLVTSRVVCNKQLADHPTIQAAAWHDHYLVGMLGIFNGLFGTIDEGPYKGYGPIIAEFEKGDAPPHDRLVRFRRGDK